MKRLTENAYGQMRTPPPSRNKSKNPSYESLYKRLAAIEDILGDEYDLDRLRELAQADREGRCGIPPVKMHQKVFRVFNGEIYEEIVCNAIWEPLMPRPRWKVFVMGAGLPYYWNDVLGKTVFLTRAEADAALKAREALDDGNE